MDNSAFVKTFYGILAALGIGVMFAFIVKFLIHDAGKIDLSTKTVVFITLCVPLFAGGYRLLSSIPDKSKEYFSKKIT